MLHQIFVLPEISTTLCSEVQNLVTPKFLLFTLKTRKIQTGVGLSSVQAASDSKLSFGGGVL